MAKPSADTGNTGGLLNDDFMQRVAGHLTMLYPEHESETLALAAIKAIGIDPQRTVEPRDSLQLWSQADVLAITYGDTISDADRPPLQVLAEFFHEHLDGVISSMHILPFCPYSSDDGFSVIDYRAVDNALGTWDDVSNIANEYTLMTDLVLNHASAESSWFQQFIDDVEPGRSFFKTATVDDDLGAVVRPRTHPLLREVATASGTRLVWCTFSHDQVDLDFANPDVLLTFLSIIDFYVQRGVRWIRLDAVAYLWKVPGTSCLHLPETHEVIRLLRTLLEWREADALIITETNVPSRENLSYFGNRNEAHLIYNFSLAPLIVHALLTGRSKHLTRWMMSMPPAVPGTSYLNFIASHDGLGVRPAEGLLDEADIAVLVETAQAHGGHISNYGSPDGLRPYELNISLFDLLAGDSSDDGQADASFRRFICAHTIMLALEGIPAFYIHSLLATPNDDERLAATGAARSINRGRLEVADIDRELADPTSVRARIFSELIRRISIRAAQPAFHPNAVQFTLQVGPDVFGFWRQSTDRTQSIFALNNLSSEPRLVPLSSINLVSTDDWHDLLTAEPVVNLYGELELAPYQSVWLTNVSTLTNLSE